MVKVKLGWEPVNEASTPGSARTWHKEPTTDRLSVPSVRRGLEKVTIKVTPCSQCFCSFYLGQILVEKSGGGGQYWNVDIIFTATETTLRPIKNWREKSKKETPAFLTGDKLGTITRAPPAAWAESPLTGQPCSVSHALKTEPSVVGQCLPHVFQPKVQVQELGLNSSGSCSASAIQRPNTVLLDMQHEQKEKWEGKCLLIDVCYTC